MAKLADRPIAAYRVRPATFWISLFVGFLLQISLPLKVPLARLFDFPLLLTIYYASVQRNKIFGTGLGAGLGIVQDALSHGLIGMFGIADTLVGYLAAAASVKFDVEQLGGRYILTGVMVLVHSFVLLALRHLILETAPPLAPLDLASTVTVNVALALIGYPVLDRFKRPA